MLHSRYIVVEDFPDDKSRTIYNGSSVTEAQKAVVESLGRAEAQCVLLFAHPVAAQLRYPKQEKLDAQERAAIAERNKTAAADAKRAQAAANRDKAKQLSAEAKRLEAEAAAADKEMEKKDE